MIFLLAIGRAAEGEERGRKIERERRQNNEKNESEQKESAKDLKLNGAKFESGGRFTQGLFSRFGLWRKCSNKSSPRNFFSSDVFVSGKVNT